MRVRASTLLLLLLPVLGGLGGWWLLAREAGEDVTADPLQEREVEVAPEGPTLRAGARAATSTKSVALTPVRVRVVDDKGRGLEGIRVTARVVDAPDATQATPPGDEVRPFAAKFLRVPEPIPDSGLVAEGKSGPGGDLTLLAPWTDELELRAEPVPPLVGSLTWTEPRQPPPADPILLRVAPGSGLAGRVVDARGEGLDATVTAWAEAQPDDHDWFSLPQRTQAGTGRFTFAALRPGVMKLLVLVRGRYRGVLARVTLPHMGEVVIRLEDDLPLLRGVVRTTAGAPIEGAYVAVTLGPAAQAGQAGTWLTGVELLARSDASGSYVITGPFGGDVERVTAAGPGTLVLTQERGELVWPGLELVPGRTATLDLVLRPGGSLEGSVREIDTGKPVAGATIGLHMRVSAHGEGPEEVLSDAAGRYRIDDVPGGFGVLFVRHPTHYLPLQAAARIAPGAPAPPRGEHQLYPPPGLLVEMPAEGTRLVRDLLLARGVPVRGRVVGPADEPVAQAMIKAWREEEESGSRWAVDPLGWADVLAMSGDDGRFEVEGLPPGSGWQLIALRAPFVGEPSNGLRLDPGRPLEDVTLRLGNGATVAGRVVDAREQPLEGVRLQVWTSSERTLPHPALRSGPSGAFRIEGLPPGSMWVEVSESEHGNGYADVDDLGANEVREGVQLTLDGTLGLRVRIVDARGRPHPDRSIWLRQGQNGSAGSSDERGIVRLSGLQAGRATLHASGETDAAVLAEVTLPAEEIQLVVPASTGRLLKATVVDAQDRPVPRCKVHLRGLSTGPRSWQAGVGWYSAVDVLHGIVRVPAPVGPLSVEVSGARDGQDRPLNLLPTVRELEEPPSETLVIRLVEGRVVRGAVVDEAGRGVSGTVVSCEGIACRTNAAGEFEIGGLREGSLEIDVEPPAPYVRPRGVTARPGIASLRVEVQRGGSIAGLALDSTGAPARDGAIEARWRLPSEGSAYVQVAHDGSFRLDGLPLDAPVDVYLQVDADDDEPGLALVLRGASAGAEDLRVRMPSLTAIDGRIVTQAGQGHRARVDVQREPEGTWDTWEAAADADGAFRLEDVFPGQKVWLRARSFDDASTSDVVEVVPPATGVVLRLPPLAPITGRLEGAGKDRWQIVAALDGARPARTATTVTESDGTFGFDGVTDAGTWTLLAIRNGEERYARLAGVRAGTADVRLVLTAARVIEGRVTDARGHAVQNAPVTLGREGWTLERRTDARGAFRISGVPPGRYDVRAYAWGVGLEDDVAEGVADGTTGVELVLTRRKP